MNVLPKPRKRIRIERPEPQHEVHDDAHSWAVSYADFLMVLLSFFIIFFSIDSNKRMDLIDKIAMQTTAKGGANAKGKDRSDQAHARLPTGVSDVATGVDGFFIQRPDSSQKLFIYFEDNIYSPGEIDLRPAQVEKLKSILGKLEPYMSEINITFVGHTDPSVVSRSKNQYLSDNFDLSSLRATKALQQARRAGFDPTRMFAKGVAEHSRGSRTLSLVITPSEVEQ